MSFSGGKLIWQNGQMIPWDQATVHVMAHALHYGSSVFEGIRVYKTPEGPQVFRLTDHMQRFYDSAKIYRMPLPFERDELIEVCKQLITANDLMNGAYIRPIAFRGYGEPGLAPKPDHKVDVAIAAWEWGAYLGAEGLEKVVSASAFRNTEFGELYGVRITDGPLKGLFARAVVVVDENGRVVYNQLVSEIADEPDYEAALKAVKR